MNFNKKVYYYKINHTITVSILKYKIIKSISSLPLEKLYNFILLSNKKEDIYKYIHY